MQLNDNTVDDHSVLDHDQVLVHGVHIDAGLVDVIQRLWKAGIRTHYSCEGGGGKSANTLAYVVVDRWALPLALYMLRPAYREVEYVADEETATIRWELGGTIEGER